MTQKDYVRIVALVRQMPPKITKGQLLKELCLLFVLDNPRFKSEKFLTACGDPK